MAKNLKVEWNWMHFRKLCFPTIEVAAVHPIHCIIHAFFWRSSFGFGRLQNASPTRPRAIILIFLLFFIRSILRGKQSTKMKSSHRLCCIFCHETIVLRLHIAWGAICHFRLADANLKLHFHLHLQIQLQLSESTQFAKSNAIFLRSKLQLATWFLLF